MKLSFAVTLVCLAMAPPLSAQERTTGESIQFLLGDSAQYRKVITELQAAVRAHDAAGVAPLVDYPIKVRIQGKKRTIKTPQKFIAKYDSIVTPAVTSVVQDAKWDSLFVNSKGVMLGRGEVWIGSICPDLHCSKSYVRVITIQAAPTN